MKGRIDFRYDAANDVVIATPHWKIETDADVVEWYGQWAAYLKRFGRRMDFVVVLDDFEITPNVGPKWGEYRAKLHLELTRYTYRVHPSARVRLFTNTSGVRYDVETQEAATVEDGILAIKAARAKENVAS